MALASQGEGEAMFDHLDLDVSAFEKWAERLGGSIEQLPFAISVALNDAAFATRSKLIEETWPAHVHVRNKGFLRAALRVQPSSKHELTVTIFDTLHRGHLGLHAMSGIKLAKGRLAIPTASVRRNSDGRIQRSQLPRNIKRVVVKNNMVFAAIGRGKNEKLVLMYRLRPSARIKKDVPFHEDFASDMRAEIMRRFPAALAKAMRTAR
jgi:hypothetical protein